MTEETKDMDFEGAFKKLEETVARLEDQPLTLEEALKAYEVGVRMAEICSKRLSEAQRRVEVLIKTNAGKFKTVPLEEPPASIRKSRKKNA
jgi:exodeoxyribonuclease VII small subunit